MPPVSEVEIAVPGEGAGGLSREDCLCPVCLEIFLEPVTLPCTHTFCKACFLETVDKANMCCPLCRKRVSTWARRNSKNKTLVNVDLWHRIQNAFPEQCQKRLNGQEDDYSTLVTTPKVCQPGELRREYEDEVSKLEKERQALEEAEQRASEEYIQRLLAEDEQRLAEERRRQEQSQQQDEVLARQLNQELNSSDPVSQTNSRPVEIVPLQKKKPGAGDIQKFFSPARNKHSSASDSSPSSGLLANKENIWTLESSTLSPQRSDSLVSQDLPALDYYGPPAHSASSSRSFPDHHFSSPCSPYSICSSSSGDIELTDIQSPERSTSSASAKRKSGQIESDDDGTGAAAPKRPRAAPSVAEAPGPSLLQQLTRQEEELQERRRQEEEDRRLALQLQRELDREERSRATDRSKSSADPYQLRQKTARSAAEDDAAAPLTPHVTRASSTGGEGKGAGGQMRHQGKTPKRRRSAPPAPAASSSSTPASATTTTPGPLKKDRKQVTIKDLFSLLSS